MAAPGSCGILRDMSGVLYFRNSSFTSSESGNMKTRGFILMFAVLCLSNVRAQTPGPVNYDEQKVPQYRLPDVLTCADGTPVTSRRQWEHRRRGEVLQLLAEQEYGITPRGRVRMDCRVLRENPQALGGLATSQPSRDKAVAYRPCCWLIILTGARGAYLCSSVTISKVIIV